MAQQENEVKEDKTLELAQQKVSSHDDVTCNTDSQPLSVYELSVPDFSPDDSPPVAAGEKRNSAKKKSVRFKESLGGSNPSRTSNTNYKSEAYPRQGRAADKVCRRFQSTSKRRRAKQRGEREGRRKAREGQRRTRLG